MSLFATDPQGFRLHSGSVSWFKIDCDFLTDDDLATLARMISKRITFGYLEGVPRGGLRLAKALAPYLSPHDSTLLIVDDVLTTGKSMEEWRRGRLATGVVIFARTDMGLLSEDYAWINPIFMLHTGF